MIRMPSVLASRQTQQQVELSLLAAQSGLDYAVHRFRSDPAWEGGTGREVALEQDGMRVVEEDGLVTGELKLDGGPSLYFRFRFKPDEEGEFISVNNLGSEVPVPLPQADPQGPTSFEVPAHTVCLFVEGGVGELNESGRPRQPGKVIEAVYRLVPDGGVKDAVLMAAGDMSLNVAAGDGQVFLSGTYLDRADGDVLRLRSKKRVEVVHGGGGLAELKLSERTEAELGHSEGVAAHFDSTSVTLLEELASDGQDFYNLTWEQIPKASGKKSSRESIQIPGGVYVYGRAVPISGSTPEQRELRYYDMGLNAYLNNAENLAENPNKGVVLSPRLEEIRSNQNFNKNKAGFSFKPGQVSFYRSDSKTLEKYPGFRLDLKEKNLFVVPSEKGREDLVIIPRSPQKFDLGDQTKYPNVDDNYNPDHLSIRLTDSTITVPGDVFIQGGVNGKGGTIVSEGDISILAGRTLELESEGRSAAEMERELEAQLGLVEQLASGVQPTAETDSASLQLNLYGKGDLTLSTFVDRRDSYRSLAFRGLLYSWGDINVWAGKGSKANRGNFTLQGAMVAYGNNPSTGSPGGMGRGNMDVRARNINLAWDPRYLPSLSELQPDNRSSFALRQARRREVR